MQYQTIIAYRLFCVMNPWMMVLSDLDSFLCRQQQPMSIYVDKCGGWGKPGPSAHHQAPRIAKHTKAPSPQAPKPPRPPTLHQTRAIDKDVKSLSPNAIFPCNFSSVSYKDTNEVFLFDVFDVRRPDVRHPSDNRRKRHKCQA